MEVTVRPPLTTEEGLASDHGVVHAVSAISGTESFTKKHFFMRRRTKKADRNMSRWLREMDWSFLKGINCVDRMTETFISTIEEKMDEIYPMIRRTKKSSDPPWMTPQIKKRIRSRKRSYKREDRGPSWRKKKKMTADLVKKAKKDFYNKFVELAKRTNDAGLYYRAVSNLKESEAPKSFSVADLFPNTPIEEIAERTADLHHDCQQIYAADRKGKQCPTAKTQVCHNGSYD